MIAIDTFPTRKPLAVTTWTRRGVRGTGPSRSAATSWSRFFYGAAAETSMIARWLLLKVISVTLRVTGGRSECVERRVIGIGNRIFPSKYRLEMFTDFYSYIDMMDFGLDDYAALQPPETWLYGRVVLDVGSGLGQYSNELRRRGAKHVTGLEYQPNKAQWRWSWRR